MLIKNLSAINLKTSSTSNIMLNQNNINIQQSNSNYGSLIGQSSNQSTGYFWFRQ
ncbi:hypothetical protein PPL_05465 [Heterostelium album PN500]|uniref:Uncharacterized protein n=1 Tax=Heterostelium pallidum (strain ATCC 26659 / Pp 5 / PN500) TaxID=670386 RepID=D3BA90_HETP5|nr:hypothetical protein PPL_05465 [Heterostelium album PN500]EFA81477.1 hypothetical protein PPL_05465 [Heterostelium album PN500]|eukprot:XP_020433595.1 hypothetical protein PPL_05465 [Heterostelium album PN500]